MEDGIDDLLGGRSAQLSVDIEQDAVREDRRDERFDVVGRHEITTIKVGRGLRSAVERNGRPGASAETHVGAGISIETIEDLRFGAEALGEIALNGDTGGNWVGIGPNMSWSHGRSWVSASYLIGVYQIRDAPRLNWGIAF